MPTTRRIPSSFAVLFSWTSASGSTGERLETSRTTAPAAGLAGELLPTNGSPHEMKSSSPFESPRKSVLSISSFPCTE